MTLIFAPLVTLLLSLILPQAAMPALRKFGSVDYPNHRSSHTFPVLRGAGIATCLAIFAGMLIAWLDLAGEDSQVIAASALFAISAAALGFFDDVRSLSATFRLSVQLTISICLSVYLVVTLGAPLWLMPVGVVFGAAYINVANFMDGINGISSLHGFVVGLQFIGVGLVAGHEWLTVVGSCLAAGFIGFLPWNLRARRLFLGDVGSYLLGGLIASAVIAGVCAQLPILALAAPLLPYIMDTGMTFAARLFAGAPVLEPHRDHIYQRLARRFGHVRVSIAVTVVSGVSGMFGGLTLSSSPALVAIAIAGLIFLVIGCIEVGRRTNRWGSN